MTTQEAIENQVITYTAPWSIFALGFSCKPQYPFRLGIGSFLPDVNNEVPTGLLRSKSSNSTSRSVWREGCPSPTSTRRPS